MNDTPENREALGRRIAEARIAAGYTNKSEFCRLIGVRDPTLYRWESGQIAPEIWNLHEIGRLCRVSMEWLMTGAVSESREAFHAWRAGKGLTPDALSFLEGLDLGGYTPSPLFYDLALLAWQRGLSREEAARAAKVTEIHRPIRTRSKKS